MKAIVACVLLLAGSVCLADGSEKERDIRKFFRLMSVGELAIQDMRRNAEAHQRSDSGLPPEFWTELFSELTPARLEERMVPIYDRRFSHEDIKAWIAFYESGAGQSWLKNQPEVLTESMVAGQALVQELGAPILERLKSR